VGHTSKVARLVWCVLVYSIRGHGRLLLVVVCGGYARMSGSWSLGVSFTIPGPIPEKKEPLSRAFRPLSLPFHCPLFTVPPPSVSHGTTATPSPPSSYYPPFSTRFPSLLNVNFRALIVYCRLQLSAVP
jgi:hypothetical protein